MLQILTVLLQSSALGLHLLLAGAAAPPPQAPAVDPSTGIACPVPGALDPADPALREFAPVSSYLLTVDEREVPAEVYQSRHLTVLVVSSALPKALLLRAGTLAAVAREQIQTRPDGGAAVAPGSRIEAQGSYSGDNIVYTFQLAGHQVALRPRPPLDFLRAPADGGIPK
jgi:hypothetical protein